MASGSIAASRPMPRTDGPADVCLDIGALAAAYLGATSLGALAAGGRVEELNQGTLAAASAAFGWRRSPSAIETF
jgi:Sterol carrier protein domain